MKKNELVRYRGSNTCNQSNFWSLKGLMPGANYSLLCGVNQNLGTIVRELGKNSGLIEQAGDKMAGGLQGLQLETNKQTPLLSAVVTHMEQNNRTLCVANEQREKQIEIEQSMKQEMSAFCKEFSANSQRHTQQHKQMLKEMKLSSDVQQEFINAFGEHARTVQNALATAGLQRQEIWEEVNEVKSINYKILAMMEDELSARDQNINRLKIEINFYQEYTCNLRKERQKFLDENGLSDLDSRISKDIKNKVKSGGENNVRFSSNRSGLFSNCQSGSVTMPEDNSFDENTGLTC